MPLCSRANAAVHLLHPPLTTLLRPSRSLSCCRRQLSSLSTQTNIHIGVNFLFQHAQIRGLSSSVPMKSSTDDALGLSELRDTLPDVQGSCQKGERKRKHKSSQKPRDLQLNHQPSPPERSEPIPPEHSVEAVENSQSQVGTEKKQRRRRRRKRSPKETADMKSVNADIATHPVPGMSDSLQQPVPYPNFTPTAAVSLTSHDPAFFSRHPISHPTFSGIVSAPTPQQTEFLRTPQAAREPHPFGRDQVFTRPQPAPFTGSSAYLNLTNPNPQRLSTPQPLLIVLDLNGTLLHRRERSNSGIALRPGLHEFLSYAFTQHCVMVWTSAQPHSCSAMLEVALTEPSWHKALVASWARDTLGLPSHLYNRKVKVTKDLDQIWGNRAIQLRHPWQQYGWSWGVGNTVLVDDSIAKAWKQPYNLCEMPEFTRDNGEVAATFNSGLAPLNQLAHYIENLRHFDNVAAYMRRWPFGV